MLSLQYIVYSTFLRPCMIFSLDLLNKETISRGSRTTLGNSLGTSAYCTSKRGRKVLQNGLKIQYFNTTKLTSKRSKYQLFWIRIKKNLAETIVWLEFGRCATPSALGQQPQRPWPAVPPRSFPVGYRETSRHRRCHPFRRCRYPFPSLFRHSFNIASFEKNIHIIS